jgi:hypothetical protein
MDPLGIVVAALVLGAVRGAATVGEQAITDAYAALKRLLFSRYPNATSLRESIAGLEHHPESVDYRAALEGELRAAGASEDTRLLAAAESLLAAAGSLPGVNSIGVDWRDVKATHVTLEEVHAHAGGIGLRAVRSEISDLTINRITAGDPGK